ncbi:hypothetical protein, partial [Streptobacillus moniliformis]|uniref:hypothetical protein n=1 Tax=Streptobacillus moniliformis TaxID=34105 RepID=UPI000B00073B
FAIGQDSSIINIITCRQADVKDTDYVKLSQFNQLASLLHIDNELIFYDNNCVVANDNKGKTLNIKGEVTVAN